MLIFRTSFNALDRVDVLFCLFCKHYFLHQQVAIIKDTDYITGSFLAVCHSVSSRHLPGGGFPPPPEMKSPAVYARRLNVVVQCVLIPVCWSVSFCNKIKVAFCICVSAKPVRIILGSRVQYQTCGEAPGQFDSKACCVLTCVLVMYVMFNGNGYLLASQKLVHGLASLLSCSCRFSLLWKTPLQCAKSC